MLPLPLRRCRNAAEPLVAPKAGSWASGHEGSTSRPALPSRRRIVPRTWRQSSSSTAGIGDWPPDATCCGHPRSALRWSPERLGSMSSARAAGPAGRSIYARSTVTRWPRSALWCSGCGAHGVLGRRRCRSYWGYTLCRRPLALATGPRKRNSVRKTQTYRKLRGEVA
jgi:hypothetical protein